MTDTHNNTYYANIGAFCANISDAWNVGGIFHTGDLVSDLVYDNAFQNFGGRKFIIAPGNHDANANKSTDYIASICNPTSMAWLNGVRTGGVIRDGSWWKIKIGCYEWKLVALPWAPTDAELSWADTIVKQDPTMRTIVGTHAYLTNAGIRYDWAIYGNTQAYNPHDYSLSWTPNDGQEIWDKLIQQNSNIKIVLCGHDLGAAQKVLTSTRLDGTICHQIVANYQSSNTSCSRLMYFNYEQNVINVKTYKADTNTWLASSADMFDLVMP